MADIITSHIPPYANDGASPPSPLTQRWVDNGDSHALTVSLVTDSGTPAGPEVITSYKPPYARDTNSDPSEPLKQRWVDMGDYHALFVILETF